MRRILVLVTASTLACMSVLTGATNAQAQTSPPEPQFELSPNSGPVGTLVQISGQLTSAQAPVWGPQLEHPAYFTLIGDAISGLPAQCELLVELSEAQVHLDAASLRVEGSFIIDHTGVCSMSRPDGSPHPVVPGRYSLSIGCHGCSVGSFTVTPSSGLPVTGTRHFGRSVAIGAGLVAAGLVFVCMARPRRRLADCSSTVTKR